MFDYPFPFTHFSCRAISFCSYKYTNPSSGSFVSANTLPLIRRFPFHGVGEYFSPGEKYFVFLKKEMAAGFYTFLISRDICSPISYYFPKLFSQAFPEDRLYQLKCWLEPLSSVQGIILFLLFVFAASFSGSYWKHFSSESGDSVPLVCQRSCACLCWINPWACFMIYFQTKLSNQS